MGNPSHSSNISTIDKDINILKKTSEITCKQANANESEFCRIISNLDEFLLYFNLCLPILQRFHLCKAIDMINDQSSN